MSAWFLYLCTFAAAPYVGTTFPKVEAILRYPDEQVCRAALIGAHEITWTAAACAPETPKGVVDATERCTYSWYATMTGYDGP